MPVEAVVFEKRPEPLTTCPKCHKPFRSFLRGFTVSLWRRFFGLPYWAVICSECKDIVGYEPGLTNEEQDRLSGESRET